MNQTPHVSKWWEESLQYPEVPLAILAKAHNGHVVVLLSNLKHVKVPFSAFTPSGQGLAPDFNNLYIDDWGHTLGLGEYQAAMDWVVEEGQYAT